MRGVAPMTRRVRARVEGVVQGVGYRPFVYRLAGRAGPGRLGAQRLPRRAGGGRGRGRRGGRLRGPAGRRGAAAGHRGAGGARGGRSGRRGRVPDTRERGGGARRPDRRRRRHLCRLPGRGAGPGGPPPRLPVHQLHQLRPALHDRHRRALRPAADHDGRASRCARPAGPSTTTRPTAASTPSPTPAPSAGRGCRARAADVARDLDEGLVVAVKGLGGYHLACRADSEVAAAALRARKHREDKPFALMARDVMAAGELVDLTHGRAGAADGARAADSHRPPARGRRRGRGRGAGLARPGRDAALHAAAPPAAGRGRRARWS